MPAQSLSYAGDAYGAPQANDDRRRLSACEQAGARVAVRVITGRGDAIGRDEPGPDELGRDDVLAALRDLPPTATVRDVVEAVLGERPVGHGQTYANVVLIQRALARLAASVSGRSVAPWEPAP